MAAFENKTTEDIRDLLINAFNFYFNKTIRILPKSFIRVLSIVLAGVFITLYKQIGWLFLQLFPETAYWKEVIILGKKIRPLVKWGILIGAGPPWSGTQWKGEIAITVTNKNSTLLGGAQLKSELTGKLYITDISKFLTHDTETVNISCVETGSGGNIEAGDTLNFVNPLGNVKKTAVVLSVIIDGTNDETEGEYRYRVVNRYRMQPQGGALADYRIWASDVPGLLNVYPYKDEASPSGVLIYVSGNPSVFPDRIPSDALLKQVGNACTYDPKTGKATRKPITAVIDPAGDGSYSHVKPVSVIEFDIYINGLAGIIPSDFAEAVRPAVENYFLGREPYIRGLSDDNNKTNIVSRNNVSSVVDQIAISVKAEFDSVTMRLEENIEPSYTLSMGEVSKLRHLFINEVEF
jgi:uncharacterized phage protein gp47/JayE